MKKLGEDKLGMEGSEEGSWILIDYGDFVVHIFSDEARTYYALEEIWGDAPRLEWRDPARIKHAPTVVEPDARRRGREANEEAEDEPSDRIPPG